MLIDSGTGKSINLDPRTWKTQNQLSKIYIKADLGWGIWKRYIVTARPEKAREPSTSQNTTRNA
ncbi:hypothetical protein Dda_7077 [Drechslerella dactyloides]|uniref:Uncharacterized protein n=1 Tax=Drechslerella dactyloides TaxID=74499 RepID=A0AAD6NH51_DREDA|nr:hypothetical protein Dda_7077 [Drechslerella dactyloides]